jgi:hypothetical protein
VPVVCLEGKLSIPVYPEGWKNNFKVSAWFLKVIRDDYNLLVITE